MKVQKQGARCRAASAWSFQVAPTQRQSISILLASALTMGVGRIQHERDMWGPHWGLICWQWKLAPGLVLLNDGMVRQPSGLPGTVVGIDFSIHTADVLCCDRLLVHSVNELVIASEA